MCTINIEIIRGYSYKKFLTGKLGLENEKFHIVEPPITDSTRYGPLLYNGQTTGPDWFAIEIVSEWEMANLLSPDNGQNTCPKGQVAVAVQIGLKIVVLMKIVKAGIKFDI